MEQSLGSVSGDSSKVILSKTYSRRGEELWEKGDIEGAAAQWAKALGLAPHLVEERIRLSQAYFELGRRKEALREARTAVALQPDCGRVHHALGQIYYRLHQCERAIQMYRAALALSPQDASLHCDLGDAYYCLEEYEEATAAYRRATQIDSSEWYGHYRLGWCLDKQECTDRAAAAFSAAIAAGANSGEAHYALGRCLATLGETQKAQRVLRRALELLAEEEEECRSCVYCELGNVQRAMGRSEEAAGAFRAALRIDPSNAAAGFNLGLACIDLEKYEEALRQFEIVRGLESDDPETRRDLGDAYYLMGEYERAQEEYREVSRLDPACGEAHAGRAMCLYEQEAFEAAIAEYGIAEQLAPENLYIKYNLALAYESAGGYVPAELWYRRTLEAEGEDAEALCGLSRVLVSQGKDLEEALSTALRAVGSETSRGECWNVLGRALGALGRFREALEASNRALSLEPENAEFLLHAGLCHEGLRRPELAEAFYRKALELEPDYEEAQEALARVEDKLI